MQINLDKSDRRLLAWTGVILLPIIVVLTLFAQDDEEESAVPSTYSAQRKGAKAAYLFLKEEGYRVERWETSPTELPGDAGNTVLVLASPAGAATKEEATALAAYLNRGGRILATGYGASFFLPEIKAEPEVLPSRLSYDYEPKILTPLTRAGTIRMSPTAYWSGLEMEKVVHYAHEGRPIVVSYKFGRGEVVWWGGNTPLTNAGIGQGGNLSLLLASLGGSKDVRILWDEFFHTSRPSSGVTIALPPLGFGLAQCALLYLALLFTYSRRSGPIRPLTEPSRLSPLEFVHTLGGLYRRAQATRIALEVPYLRFRTLLIRKMGLRKDSNLADLARAAETRLGHQGLGETFEQVAASLYDPDLSEARALDLVQQISRHAHDLRLVSQQEEQEKIPHANRQPGTGPRTH